MRLRHSTLSLAILLGVTLSLTAGAAGQDIPSVKEIIAKYLTVTGGEEKHAAIKSAIVEGTMSIPEAGIGGAVTIHQKGSKILLSVEIDGIGNQSQGFDGETAWQNSVMTGPEIFDGERLQQFKLTADLQPFVDFESKYKSATCTKIVDFNGQKCYEVVAELKGEGYDPITNYFSVDSGLHVGSKSNQVVQADTKMEIVTEIGDYREVEGLKYSHKATARLDMVGMSQVIEVTSVKLNPEVDESLFELPAEVKALKDGGQN